MSCLDRKLCGWCDCLFANDTASQGPVVGSAQRVAVVCAWAPRDAVVQYCLEYLGTKDPDFELEGSTRSVVQLEGVLPEPALCVAYAPVDLDSQVGVVVDVPPEVCEFVRLVVLLADCLYAKYGVGLRHSLRA